MSKSKTVNVVCYIALAVMLILAVSVWVFKAAEGRKKSLVVGYEALFDKSYVHTINIEIDNWEDFISTATDETYVACNVVIDGQRVNNVGIRAKGNTSLSSVASQGSEKYSFKIEFDQYVDGNLYKGLDKLSLNNLIYDATMMKDYLAYTLMAEMDVPSPLCSFTEILVNGESWGLYLAVEGVEDSFLERNNMTRGELYKPDSMSFGGGRGNGRDFDFDKFRVDDSSEETPQPAQPSQQSMPQRMPGNMPQGNMPQSMPEGMEGMSFPGGSRPEGMPNSMPSGDMPSDMPEGMTFPIGGFNFNFGMGSSDVKLQYSDDDSDSYSNIFNNAKTVVTKADQKRLIKALKNLNEQKDIEQTVFTDEVIRYLAVHDFLQNSDSYTGMMVHNYYLYEEDGQLAIIPWDYNLAFGGMNGSNGTSLVNSSIDNPVTTGSTSDRPLIAWIFDNEEYLEKYHEMYEVFLSEYIESGWLENEISRVATMIRSYVEEDLNSFYSVDEFDTAIATLKDYCSLRGQSIRGQLDGTDTTVDGSALDVSSMGSMNTGNGGGGDFDFKAGGKEMPQSMGPSDMAFPPGQQVSDNSGVKNQIIICVVILLAGIGVVCVLRKHNA